MMKIVGKRKRNVVNTILCMAILLIACLPVSMFLGGGAAADPGQAQAMDDDYSNLPVWNGSAASSFAGGTGASDNPYLISNGEQLAYLAQVVNNNETGPDSLPYNASGKHYKLTNDILLNDLSLYNVWSEGLAPKNKWTPIGNSTYLFVANFNGDHHAIIGMYISTISDDARAGFFGTIGAGTVSNLGVEKSYIRSSDYAGGIAAYVENGAIINCYNTGTISGSRNLGGGNDSYVGGISAFVGNGAITNCYNTGTISGDLVGGISGYSNGAITNCYNTGTISGDLVGGISGYGMAIITNCYNTGTISSVDSGGYAGGITGYSDGATTNCYNTGTISGDNAAGIVGDGSGNTTYSYYLEGTAAAGVGTGMDMTEEFDQNGSFAVTTNVFDDEQILLDALNAWVADDGSQSYSEWQETPFPVFEWQANRTGDIWSGNTATQFAGGDGTGAYPFLIANGEQLSLLAGTVNIGTAVNDSNTHYALIADIILNDTSDWTNWTSATSGLNQWMPIGNVSNPFKANFNGNGYAVVGVFKSGTGAGGLFEENDGTISNLGVEKSLIIGGNYSGGIAGNNDGTITNCYNTGMISVLSGEYTGGIAGQNNGEIINCYNTGTISAIGNTSAYAGGIVGMNYSEITNCYNTGMVSATLSSDTSSQAGGIAGYNNSGTITNCYSTGIISASGATANHEGGIAGENTGDIIYSYYLENTADDGVGNDTGTSATAKFNQNGFLDPLSTNVYDNKAYLVDALNAWVNSVLQTGTTYNQWHGTPFPTFTSGIWDGTPAEFFAGGTGTKLNPFLIANGEQLSLLAKLVNENRGYEDDIGTVYNTPNNSNTHYALIADIILNDTSDWTNWTSATYDLNYWTPIGNELIPFKANFNGNGYAVIGVFTSTTNASNGLFGTIGLDGTISNLGVEKSLIIGGQYVGGIVGGIVSNNNGTITNCYNTGTISTVGEGGSAGGIAGYNNGEITDCYNTGTITASGFDVHAGGIAGHNYETITNCYNTGTITVSGGNDGYAGGIAGWNEGGTITNCYNTGTITAGCDSVSSAAGIAGWNHDEITNCYNTGTITVSGGNDGYAGGIAGHNYETITNCYNTGTITVSGGNDVHAGGIAGWNYGEITNCYNTGTITVSGGNDGYAGGIAAYVENGTITNCYNTGEISASGTGTMYLGGIAGSNSGNLFYSYYLGGTTAGVGTGADTTAEFDQNGDFDVTTNVFGYKDNLLDALNAWVSADQTDPNYLYFEATDATSGPGVLMFRFVEIPTYAVTLNGNITSITSTVTHGDTNVQITIVAGSGGTLPSMITVEMNGITLTLGTDYTYIQASGLITIMVPIDGAVEISADVTYTVTLSSNLTSTVSLVTHGDMNVGIEITALIGTLPATITVTMNGVTLPASEYTWLNGILTITGPIDGNVVITGAVTYTVTLSSNLTSTVSLVTHGDMNVGIEITALIGTLPATITVTMNGVTLPASEYTWLNGILTITGPIDGNVVITGAVTYTVSLDIGTGGTVYYRIAGGTEELYTNPIQVQYGLTVEFRAVPNSGYVFSHWLIDSDPNEISGNTTQLSVSSNHTIKAVFTFVSGATDSDGDSEGFVGFMKTHWVLLLLLIVMIQLAIIYFVLRRFANKGE